MTKDQNIHSDELGSGIQHLDRQRVSLYQLQNLIHQTHLRQQRNQGGWKFGMRT